jgi:hypothetical protein
VEWSRHLALAVLAASPLVVASLFVKGDLLTHGLSGPLAPLPADLTVSLPYFSADLLQTVGLVPLVLAASFGWLPERRRVIVMTMIVLVLTSIIAAGWMAFLAIGGWPTRGLVEDFLFALRAEVGLVDPTAYLPRGVFPKAGALVALGVVPLILAVDRVRARLVGGNRATAVLATSIGVMVIATAGQLSSTGYPGLQRGILLRLLAVPVARADPGNGFAPGLEPDWSTVGFPSVGAASRALPPAPSSDQACQSAIVVVLETAADRDYSWPMLREAMPRNRRYLDHALVGTRHFASHSTSNRSDFTLLTGVYDVTGIRSMQRLLRRANAPSSSAPGIVSTLRARGFDTRYYYPTRFTVEDDEWAVHYLGFETIFAPSRARASGLTQASRLTLESDVFARAAADLAQLPRDRPFFVVLRTMIGHDPVFSPRTGAELDPTDRGGRSATYRDIAGFLDSLLLPVMTAAARHRDTARIALAIVGDHGIRNRRDPDLAGGGFPLVGHRVPAVLSCPSLFPTPIPVPQATSHADIAPTLAWILGIDLTPHPVHGLPMVDPRLADRFVFLFAGEERGYDAVVHRDTLVAVNRVLENSSRLLLGDSPVAGRLIEVVSPPSPAIEARLGAMQRVQYRLVERLARGGAPGGVP